MHGHEADFLLAVIATSLFVSPIWSNVLHYLVVRSKIHLVGEPTKLSNAPGWDKSRMPDVKMAAHVAWRPLTNHGDLTG